MELALHRLVSDFRRELFTAIREGVKWIFVGVVCFLGMLFLIVGLPRIVAVINTLTSPNVISSVAAQNDAPHRVDNSR